MQLIDELLPEVPGAPNLGGHNRSGESIKATKAKQKQMQQMQSPAMDPATSVALQRRPVASTGGNVAQAPSAQAMRNNLVGMHEAAWEQAPILVRVSALLGAVLLLKSQAGLLGQCFLLEVFWQ